ncbi:MAG: hypothetical protein ACI9UU_003225 [Candidatus Azotimanducaceae bacterium]
MNEPSSNPEKPVSKQALPWRLYRIVGGLLTLYFGFTVTKLIYTYFGAAQSYSLISRVLTGEGQDVPESVFFGLSALIIIIFFVGGILFSRKEPKGVVFVWIAAIFSLPVAAYTHFLFSISPGVVNYPISVTLFVVPALVSIYLFWILIRTRTYKEKPSPSWTALALTTVAVLAIYVSPGIWYHFMAKEPPLIRAVSSQRTETVKALLESGASANQKSRNGTTALVHSLEIQHGYDMAMLLLEHGADPNQASVLMWPDRIMSFDGYGMALDPALLHTPLRLALLCHFCGPEVAMMMINRGADVSASKANQFELNILNLAIAMNVDDDNSQYELIAELLKRNSPIDPNVLLETEVINYDAKPRIVELLVKNGVETDGALEWLDANIIRYEEQGWPPDSFRDMRDTILDARSD